jgi:general secretion pathway protein H
MTRARGFTLIEMLIVLVIGGLLVGLASLTLARNPRTDLIEQARRLALIFETAGDEAQLRAAPLEWLPVNGGYRFMVRTGSGWRPVNDDLLGPKRWAETVSSVAIRYSGDEDGKRSKTLIFGTESISQPVSVTLYGAAGSITIASNGNGRFDVLNTGGAQ